MPSPRPTPELRQWSNPVWYAATGEPGAQACRRTSANLLAARDGLAESSSCPESSSSSYSPRDMQPDYAFAVGVEGVPLRALEVSDETGIPHVSAGEETKVERRVGAARVILKLQLGPSEDPPVYWVRCEDVVGHCGLRAFERFVESVCRRRMGGDLRQSVVAVVGKPQVGMDRAVVRAPGTVDFVGDCCPGTVPAGEVVGDVLEAVEYGI